MIRIRRRPWQHNGRDRWWGQFGLRRGKSGGGVCLLFWWRIDCGEWDAVDVRRVVPLPAWFDPFTRGSQ